MSSSEDNATNSDKSEVESANEMSDTSESSNESDDEKPKLVDNDFRQMPFEELLKLKRRLGSKVYNEAVFGKTSDKEVPRTSSTERQKKRVAPNVESDSDGPPEEISAKRKVPALGMAKNRTKTEHPRSKDPRFDSKQGYFSGRQFRSQYGFINEMRSDELVTLQKQLEEEEDPAKVEKLKFAIRRTENQIREFDKQSQQDQKRKEQRLLARKTIDDGKQPFYEKKSVTKARDLVEKYNQLKESGKLGKHIDKRRRKNTAKDRKKLNFAT
ncbi:ribosomal RNA processing protein 36 homolog [Sabethes cyaneus]|uniref:ribosomal RNA processing protein 36 homolog n=1 Tax=Sabethes cyaneus TaxID=53552 RepID=UPI00237E9502|nr:ribosomal RNA processing protein 36 homolog [Sabethes cyaneus]